MASTFKSVQVTRNDQPRLVTPGVYSTEGTYELLTSLVDEDVIQMVPVPKGAVVNEVILAVDDLDTGAALVLDVGDGGDPDRFIDTAGIGQAAGVARLNAVDGLNYKYTAADTIDVHVETAPQTGAATGTIRLAVFFSADNPPQS